MNKNQPTEAIAEKPADYQHAMQQAEAGNYDQALDFLNDYLGENRGDAEALNDAGAILFIQGRTEQAIDHLQRAHAACSDSAEIHWNLSEAYLADGQAQKAAALFAGMEQMGILNIDLLNRTATALIDGENPAAALPLLEKSLAMAPDQEILKPIIDVVRSTIRPTVNPNP